MNKKAWIAMLGLLALLGIALLAGCSKKETTNEEQTSSGKEAKEASVPAAPIDQSTVATINGTVKFNGAVPKPTKIDMSQDAVCASKGQNVAEMIVADKGNLANVFVYVKDGLGDRTFNPPNDPVTIDQNGCRYHPHVLGVMTGQSVKITNSDNTTHNIHPTPKDNREWNESQPPKAPAIEKNFARQEILLPVKCNQHPWMKMYINVVKHPFFAVTDTDGKYTLKGLPPGTYTVAAVHEKLGEQDTQVTVAPKDTKTADFTFKAGGAAAGGQ